MLALFKMVSTHTLAEASIISRKIPKTLLTVLGSEEAPRRQPALQYVSLSYFCHVHILPNWKNCKYINFLNPANVKKYIHTE